MRTQLQSRGTIALERPLVMDYLSLTKPELTFLSVLTTFAGYYVGAAGDMHGIILCCTLLGTAMVGGGAGALNQYIERRHDGLMRRTRNRPLPSGRMPALHALVFGTFLTVAGILLLAVFANFLTALIAAVTSVTYLYLYTPLKRITPLSTLIGGIPGALPPVMGWTAARNEISGDAWILFGILFFWQIPHFLSLAWMYRKDYERAGYRLLTVVDTEGKRTGRQVLFHTVVLIPVSILLAPTGLLGLGYVIGAFLLGLIYLGFALWFSLARTNESARALFFLSLLYLPALMLVMVLDTIVR